MKLNDLKLSKVVSHALRHEPQLYNLQMDDEGWVEVVALLNALNKKYSLQPALSRNDLERMVVFSEKKRHEIEGARIRALYGHSLSSKIFYKETQPPDVLFHGTTPIALGLILRDGLKPMGRKCVHLSLDPETALSAGLRRSMEAVLLKIDSKGAHDAGVKFYYGSEEILLSSEIPSKYIQQEITPVQNKM